MSDVTRLQHVPYCLTMACLPRGARAPRREPEQREHKQHEAVTRRLDEDKLQIPDVLKAEDRTWPKARDLAWWRTRGPPGEHY